MGHLGESGIAAISAAAISFVALFVCCISYYRFRKEEARNIALSNEETERFLKGQPGSLNSAMGLSEQAHLLPFDEQWDFPPEKLKLGNLMMIVEYCPFGSLDKYLRTNKDYFSDQIDPLINKIEDNIGKQLLHSEYSHSNDTTIEAQSEGTQGSNEPVLKYVVAAPLVTGSGGTNNGLQVDLAVSDTRIPASPNRRVNDWRKSPAENSLRKSSEESVLSRQFTTGNLVSWAYQIAQGMEYLGCRKHYLDMNKPYEERNVEYFRTKTDYLQMMPVKPDDGYVRTLRSRDAGVEKYVTASHTYVNSEISQPKVHYLSMTSTKLQAHLQETMEPQIQEEIPIANSNIIVGPIIRSEQYRSTGSEPRLEIRLTSTDEDHRLDHEEGLVHEETPLDNLGTDLELITPEVSRVGNHEPSKPDVKRSIQIRHLHVPPEILVSDVLVNELPREPVLLLLRESLPEHGLQGREGFSQNRRIGRDGESSCHVLREELDEEQIALAPRPPEVYGWFHVPGAHATGRDQEDDVRFQSLESRGGVDDDVIFSRLRIRCSSAAQFGQKLLSAVLGEEFLVLVENGDGDVSVAGEDVAENVADLLRDGISIGLIDGEPLHVGTEELVSHLNFHRIVQLWVHREMSWIVLPDRFQERLPVAVNRLGIPHDRLQFRSSA
ncbi:unnamed protein product [Darwinula stevensoni]|uniref:Serine-threonine/tyrosine-protein kinase catalytic domain-containing protein n=1 Tax=Darwinula stevensoni TaxID=69355 RepID=A0A7R8XF03_9CRUS|nr:unnamed protein product [Darwinula stevensoni]CAG0895803.1 unnamed protein product [Darwinula stevensoni]